MLEFIGFADRDASRVLLLLLDIDVCSPLLTPGVYRQRSSEKPQHLRTQIRTEAAGFFDRL
jgi:hypothetical protein